jgi:hypothetical protein
MRGGPLSSLPKTGVAEALPHPKTDVDLTER